MSIYSYLRDGFRDVDIFRLDFRRLAELLRGMAYRGEWQGFFDYVTGEVQNQASIRDYLSAEKMIHGFLLAYLILTPIFFSCWIGETDRSVNQALLPPDRQVPTRCRPRPVF
jgi:hypothetical protein